MLKDVNYKIDLFVEKNYKQTKGLISTFDGKKIFLFKNRNQPLGAPLLKNIIYFCGSVLKSKFHLPVVIELGEIEVKDKLSYILLECVIYELVRKSFDVQILMEPKYSIYTQGILYSPLRFLNPYDVKYEKIDKIKRRNQFRKDFELSQSGKYRKWLSKDDVMGVSRLTTDLIYLFRNQYNSYFQSYEINEYEEFIVKKLATTIGELVDNAHEHGESDCLIDIDFSHDFSDRREEDKSFGGLNVTIVNFSKRNFGEKVKNKILNTNLNNDERYIKVGEIFNNHKDFFRKNNYNDDVFWFIASLQDKISGRDANVRNGGKGSTELIKRVQEFTHDDYCYVMSGKNIINLQKGYLHTDDEGFVGFNNSNFAYAPPEQGAFSRSCVHFPGVAYNLNFVLEEVTDEKN